MFDVWRIEVLKSERVIYIYICGLPPLLQAVILRLHMMKLEFKIVILILSMRFCWCVRLNWVILHFVGFAAFLGPAVGSLREPRGATFLPYP